MAQLPSGDWLIQQIGSEVVLFERYTEREIIRFPCDDGDAAAKAQALIEYNTELSVEDKVFAHFWSGYFYGCAVNY